MGVELSRPEEPGEPREERRRVVLPDREVEVVRPEDLEPRLGGNLPVFGRVSDVQFQLFQFVGLGGWIVMYAYLPWWMGFLAMWAWIALVVAYENEAHRRRRLRRHYRRALKYGLAVLALPAEPAPRRRERAPEPAAAPVAAAPRVSAAEKALVATVRRVDTSDRFERTDVVLVHEVADLLGPLLLRIAERGGDPQVRHDLETLAAEHLPRTVDDYLSLPPDVAHRAGDGSTPAQELRSQLHLLVEGCRQLRDAVLAADVDRQQQQSRFLETKFRRSDLDL
ncbi:hypothetical protein [Kineococcus sp. SYSU DK002]|uniref:hypothetical protein n=1 Tax=Kineococcus sp. SYSU DK002 TaxID=3383123 RepID=UPI003D7C9EE8